MPHAGITIGKNVFNPVKLEDYCTFFFLPLLSIKICVLLLPTKPINLLFRNLISFGQAFFKTLGEGTHYTTLGLVPMRNGKPGIYIKFTART